MTKNFLTLTFLCLALFGGTAARAQSWRDILKGVLNGGSSGNTNGTSTNGSGTNGNGGFSLANLSNADIVAGLREALTVGANNSSQRLSALNGFFGNAVIKVLMPPEAKKVENTLRTVGMGSLVDKAILSMNRAAEDAAGKAAPIFINAIKGMNIQDGINILRGGSGAATAFLRQRTTSALTQAFRPVIQSSLNKVGATSVWGTVFNTYNSLPTTYSKINPDLSGYVTERALNGIFLQIAEEENKIRSNPAARISSILQKVFGAK